MITNNSPEYLIDPIQELHDLARAEAEIASLEGLPVDIGLCIGSVVTNEQVTLRIYRTPHPSGDYFYDFEYREPRFNDLISLRIHPDGTAEAERFGNLHTKNGYVHQLTNPSTIRRSARKILASID